MFLFIGNSINNNINNVSGNNIDMDTYEVSNSNDNNNDNGKKDWNCTVQTQFYPF